MTYNVSQTNQKSQPWVTYEYGSLAAELRPLNQIRYKYNNSTDVPEVTRNRILEIEKRMEEIKNDYYNNNPPKGGRRYKCRKTKKSKKCKRRKTNRRR